MDLLFFAAMFLIGFSVGAMVVGVLKSNCVPVTAIISPVVMKVLSIGVILSAAMYRMLSVAGFDGSPFRLK